MNKIKSICENNLLIVDIDRQAMRHLREHPLEVTDLSLAERLSSVSDWVAGARGDKGGDGRPPGVVLEAVGGTVPMTTSGLLAEGAGLLAEMGYHGGHGDDDLDDNMLHGESLSIMSVCLSLIDYYHYY